MPILEIVAILIALAAGFIAWRATQDLKNVTAKLDRLQTTVYETRKDMKTQQQELENRIATLDVSMQKATGTLRFDPNQSLTHLFQVEPRAESVLAAFHIGGCADCAVDENGSLAQAVRERGADMDRILTALNMLPANGNPIELRMPNVKFEM